ncbi:MAG: hypothetical protein Q3Y08_07055 [Butyricicoccus sp.]|nr:hypothetical protein [Butyricicoccus sp.]
MFTERKIPAFQNRISDLPDTPTLTASELKARFDACPEELRESLNGVCEDGARLYDRVEGIVTETFGDTIQKPMLSDELAAELDAKATQTALEAETAAREALAETVAQKCEVYCGIYTGNAVYNTYGTQKITLGFRPKAVWVVRTGYKTDANSTGHEHATGGLAFDDWDGCGIRLLDDGFEVTENHTYNETTRLSSTQLNLVNNTYVYMAFK